MKLHYFKINKRCIFDYRITINDTFFEKMLMNGTQTTKPEINQTVFKYMTGNDLEEDFEPTYMIEPYL